MTTPDPLSLTVGERATLQRVDFGRHATYCRQREAYDQANASLHGGDDAEVRREITAALAVLVASCRGAIVRGEQEKPVLVALKPWRQGPTGPGGGDAA